LRIHPKVESALFEKKPVVALESTLLTHGLPYPENYNLVCEIQSKLCEEYGVTPATIALQKRNNKSEINVGLSENEIHDLCISSEEDRASKVTTRDLAFFLSSCTGSRKIWGGTTVASTMYIASLVGIHCFVTGGTGGVHRNDNILDISSDLIELSRTPVLVISAGIKSILDIAQTVETLETLGVPTAVYKSHEFPAFFSPNSHGVPSPYVVHSASEIANAFVTQQNLGINSGMLIAVPNDSSAGERVEQAIQIALNEAKEKNIQGRDVTPFVLKKINHLTKGDSLKSNISLIHNNVRIGAKIAIEISNLQRKKESDMHQVIVMGGSAIDIVAKPISGKPLLLGTSNPGTCVESDGGVARNICEALCRLGTKSIFYSAVGNDDRGNSLLTRLGNNVSHQNSIHISNLLHTATYLAILNEAGELSTAIADMDIMENIPLPPPEDFHNAKMLVMDANPPLSKLLQAAKTAVDHQVQVFLEPTSIPKAREIGSSQEFLSCVTYASPNTYELMALLDMDVMENVSNETLSNLAKKLLSKMKEEEAHLLITQGEKGVTQASKYYPNQFSFQQYPVIQKSINIHNSTGAGDTLSATFLHAILNGYDLETAVQFGMKAATTSLECKDRAISSKLNNSIFE